MKSSIIMCVDGKNVVLGKPSHRNNRALINSDNIGRRETDKFYTAMGSYVANRNIAIYV